MLISALTAAGAARLLAIALIRRGPPGLMRVNVSGRPVPAVLGLSVVPAAVVGLGCLVALMPWAQITWGPPAVLGLLLIVMGAAGAWDDWRGDERPRGFKGHLTAARARVLTGGLVKLVSGVACGALAAGAVGGGRGLVVLFAVPLSANLINLLDRAPGRALKATAVLGAAPLAGGATTGIILTAPVLGAVAGIFALDLKEQGMLGDAGANPLGAVVGLGLGATLSPAFGWVIVALLALLNVASERWSFSRAIERNRVLAWVDGLGRK